MGSQFAQSGPPSTSRNSFPHSLPLYLQTRLITTSKGISKLTWSWPTSSHPHGLQLHLQTPLITASNCLCKLARLWSPSSHNHPVHVHLQTHLITASKFTVSWSSSAYLQTRTISASKCISKLVGLQPPSVSLNSLHHTFQGYKIIGSKFISKLDRSRHRNASGSPLNHGLVTGWSY